MSSFYTPVPPSCCCCLPARGLVIFLSVIAIFGSVIQLFTEKNSETTKATCVITVIVQVGTLLAAIKYNATFMLFILWLTGISVFCSFILILSLPVLITASIATAYSSGNITIVNKTETPMTSEERFFSSLYTGYNFEATFAILFLLSGFQFILINRVRNYFLELNRVEAIPIKKLENE